METRLPNPYFADTEKSHYLTTKDLPLLYTMGIQGCIVIGLIHDNKIAIFHSFGEHLDCGELDAGAIKDIFEGKAKKGKIANKTKLVRAMVNFFEAIPDSETVKVIIHKSKTDGATVMMFETVDVVPIKHLIKNVCVYLKKTSPTDIQSIVGESVFAITKNPNEKGYLPCSFNNEQATEMELMAKTIALNIYSKVKEIALKRIEADHAKFSFKKKSKIPFFDTVSMPGNSIDIDIVASINSARDGKTSWLEACSQINEWLIGHEEKKGKKESNKYKPIYDLLQVFNEAGVFNKTPPRNQNVASSSSSSSSSAIYKK